jgi:hypothetical protein
MLTDAQRAEFSELGILRLPGIVPAEDVACMRGRLWEALEERHGIRPDDETTWSIARPCHLQKIGRSGAFEALDQPALLEAVDELLGSGQWRAPAHWGPPLVVFPSPDAEWNVPHQVWHLDSPVSGSDPRPPGLRAFAFLEKVEPRGGATAIVAGSHRRVYELAREKAPDGLLRSKPQGLLRSKQVRNELAATEPWVEALFAPGDPDARIARFLDEGTVSAGIPLRVVEATGEPGDVTLMDLRCLHSLTDNVGRRPRLVIGHAFHAHRHLAQVLG